MALGFVIIGMVAGLLSATAALVLGAGLAMAALTYVGFGLLGFGLGLTLMLTARAADSAPRVVRAAQG